ncbi:MAG: hypothetical protein H7293_03270 [Candidatus Saccharibacteria bacterium]|nr:hypothetical protein [Rhodoferax sp.]
MTVPTVTVTCRASSQSGAAIPGAIFTFKLNLTEKYNGFVVPSAVTGTADINGLCVVQLFPNALGSTGSAYTTIGTNPKDGRRFLSGMAVIPNYGCNLEDVLDLPYYAVTGTVGLKGATGDKGPIGNPGANGFTGSMGAIGPTGPTGPTGAAGGTTGAMGPTGPAGLPGTAGTPGTQGTAGPAGATGPAGPAGATGAAGPAGATGASGTSLNTINRFTKNQSVAPVALTYAALLSIDATLSNIFRLVLTGNITIQNPTNMTDGMVIGLVLLQDGAGSHTANFGSAYKFAGGTVPILSTSIGAIDYLTFLNTTDGLLLINFSKGFISPTGVLSPITSYPGVPVIDVSDRGDVFLQVGDYWFHDNPWGAVGLTRGLAGTYTGLTGVGYEQACGVSTIVGPNGEVAGRVKFAVPTGTTEVKSYPAFLVGKKPGYYNTWIVPGGIPIYRVDGSQVQINPSGSTPNTFFPLQLPIATLTTQHAYVHNAPPTGKGHLSYDIWFQNTPTQMNGFDTGKVITHEIMIPVMYWGNYGRSDRNPDGSFGPNNGRNPSWYDSDAMIDGRLYHIYRPHNADGSFIPFGSSGWHFIVFEPDVILAPQQVEKLNLVSFFNFLISKGWATNQYVSSIELGIETIEGTGDVTTYNFKVSNVPTTGTAPVIPVTVTLPMPLNNLVAIVGDGRTAISSKDSSVVQMGDKTAYGYTSWLEAASNYRAKVVGNYGVNPNTLDQMITRLTSVETRGQILNSPASVFVFLGGLNNTTEAIGTVGPKYLSLINQLTAAGKICVVMNELPNNDQNTQGAVQLGRRTYLDGAVYTNDARVVRFNSYDLMAQTPTSFLAKTGYYGDAVQPNMKGHRVLGTALGTLFNQLFASFPVRNTLATVKGALATMFDGTTGSLGTGATGVMATDWNGDGIPAGLTVAYSKGTDSDGYAQQIITVTGTPTAATLTFVSWSLNSYATDPAQFASNDVVEHGLRCVVDAGSSGLVGVSPVMAINDNINNIYNQGSSFAVNIYDNSNINSVTWLAGDLRGEAFDYVIKSSPVSAPPLFGTTASRSAVPRVDITFRGGAPVNAVIRLSRSTLHKNL